MAGDPRITRGKLRAQDVSIRARHRWRAIPLAQAMGLSDPMVSIRARHRWRAIPLAQAMGLSDPMVSIRARHRWRAILVRHVPDTPVVVFQSAPAIDGGRSWVAKSQRTGARRFNPRPPSMAGDPGAA